MGKLKIRIRLYEDFGLIVGNSNQLSIRYMRSISNRDFFFLGNSDGMKGIHESKNWTKQYEKKKDARVINDKSTR